MTTRTDWTREEIAALFDLPFNELVDQPQTVDRVHHAVGQIQLCTLLCRSWTEIVNVNGQR